MTQDDKGYQSSTDYEPTSGVTVRGGASGSSRQAHNVSDLNDNDIISIDGMELKVLHARELGLLNRVFDEGLHSGSASQQTEAPEAKVEVVQRSDTGHASYDEAIDALNALIDEGSMTPEEGQVYDTSLAQIAFAGLQVDEFAETISGLSDGSIDEADVPADLRAMAVHVEAEVTQASTKAAINELGKPAFDALTEMAASHAGVAEVIERYAIDRAQGKHNGVSWSDLYADLNEQLGNT